MTDPTEKALAPFATWRDREDANRIRLAMEEGGWGLSADSHYWRPDHPLPAVIAEWNARPVVDRETVPDVTQAGLCKAGDHQSPTSGDDGEAVRLMRAYYAADDARNDCLECENEGPWEHCELCSGPIGDAINAQLLFLAALDATPPAAPTSDDETYEIGKRDGYGEALADVDRLTGGDGEYFASTIPGRGCPDEQAMLDKIVERFDGLSPPAAPEPVGDVIERVARIIDPDAWHQMLPVDGCGLYWSGRRSKAMDKARAAIAALTPTEQFAESGKSEGGA